MISLRFFAVALLVFSGLGRAETLTYPDLVHRLTDFERLATLPLAGEKTALASSYDRSSQYDAATDKYINWSANGDDYAVVRKEGDTDVLADLKGPGCIWRMWAAKTLEGHVKIYLDGSATPAVDLPYYGYFDGQHAPFTRKNLVYTTGNDKVNGDPYAGGRNNYTPIPFQKSCKIVAEKGWGAYYQFTYSTFAEGTIVPTFNANLSAEDAAALDQADKLLGQCGTDPHGPRAGEATDVKPVTVPPGKTMTVAELDGAQAITMLKMKMAWPKGLRKDIPTARTLLRQLTMQVTWDGEKSPAIWTPLGDFFGYVGGAEFYKTLATGFINNNKQTYFRLADDGYFYSYWYMPFSKRAKIEVGNDSSLPVDETWTITHAPLDKPIADLTRLHVKWHRDAFLPTRPDRQPDWTLVTTKGRGRYVGTMLHVWNPNGGWWGEGDDKFFVDGEKFPSSFGTGSEDYFGYAWCLPWLFSKTFNAQPLCEGNTQGNQVNMRWHLADAVPFQSSIDADIEKMFPDKNPTLYAATAYWYLAPGGLDPYEPQPVTERADYWTTFREPGVIEGELLKVTENSGRPSGVTWYGRLFSGETCLIWWPNKVGMILKLTLPVEKAGSYELRGKFCGDTSSGVYQLFMDGTKIGEPLHLYHKGNREPSALLDLGSATLTAGDHELRVDLVAFDPANNLPEGATHGFVLDYLKLDPAK